MGAGKNQLRFPLTAVNGIVTETLVNLFTKSFIHIVFFLLQVTALFKLYDGRIRSLLHAAKRA
jgi:hypothetical protein